MASSFQRTVEVTVPVEDLTVFERAVFESLQKELEIPGFRRGNVPEELARQYIPQERVFREAVDRAVAQRGSAALDALGDRIVGEPKVEVMKAAPGNPLEFRVTVELLPEVSLDDWRSLRIPLHEQGVSDEDVNAALEEARRSRTKTRAVLEAAQRGDLVEVDFTTRVNGVAVEGGSSKNHPIVLGEGRFVPGFEDAIVGMAAGEEKTVRLPFPKEWPQAALAGKEGEFSIAVRSVEERILPELDDDFARSLGRFENLASLRESVRTGLLEEARARKRRRVRTEALDRLGERIPDAALPEIVVTQELERMREEFRASIERHGATFEDYLARIGKREEDLVADWRKAAVRRAKAALVLRALARAERIEASPEEVAVQTQQLLSRMQEAGGAGAQEVDPDRLRAYTESAIRNEKTLELIESVVTDNSPSTTRNA